MSAPDPKHLLPIAFEDAAITREDWIPSRLATRLLPGADPSWDWYSVTLPGENRVALVAWGREELYRVEVLDIDDLDHDDPDIDLLREWVQWVSRWSD